MKKRAFTMLEIAVICIIVGILAVLAIPYFQNIMERSKAEVCATNLKALQKAVDIYVQENDVVPAKLADLPRNDVDQAFAQLLQGKGAWKRKLAFLISDIGERGVVFAATNTFPKLRCPKAPADIEITYGIAGSVAGLPAQDYLNEPEENIIIADSNNQSVITVVPTEGWHAEWKGNSKRTLMMGVTRTGTVGCVSRTIRGVYSFLPVFVPYAHAGASASPSATMHRTDCFGYTVKDAP